MWVSSLYVGVRDLDIECHILQAGDMALSRERLRQTQALDKSELVAGPSGTASHAIICCAVWSTSGHCPQVCFRRPETWGSLCSMGSLEPGLPPSLGRPRHGDDGGLSRGTTGPLWAPHSPQLPRGAHLPVYSLSEAVTLSTNCTGPLASFLPGP